MSAPPRRLRSVALVALVLVGALVVATRWGWILKDAPAREDAVAPLIAPLPRDHAIVWAVGDGATGRRRAKRLAARIAAGHPDLVLYLGDVYGHRDPLGVLERDGSAADFRDVYQPVYGRLARITAPTPGNHEWGRRGQGYRPYWRSVTGRAPSDYYRMGAGGWELLSLNSEDGHDRHSRQYAWLRGAVRGPGTCRLAFWHRPRFSAGPAGDQEDVQPFWDLLRGHAVLVLNGHEHDLERFEPVDGITEIVAGSGGRSVTELDDDDARLAFSDDERDGALRLELEPGVARFSFVATDGQVLDSGSVPCS